MNEQSSPDSELAQSRGRDSAADQAVASAGRHRSAVHRLVGRVGDRFVALGWIRKRIPTRYRPALFLDSVYNFGTGAFFSLFLLSNVVLKTLLDGTDQHMTALAAMFGGSSLLSPLVAASGRRLRAKSMIIIPNAFVAVLLLCTVFAPAVLSSDSNQEAAATASTDSGQSTDEQSGSSTRTGREFRWADVWSLFWPITNWTATLFTAIVGGSFIIRVFPRVSEMNMYRIIYPDTHRGAAVGWLKSLAWISGLGVTLLGYFWIYEFPRYYSAVFILVALMLAIATAFFARIPISRRNVIDLRASSKNAQPHGLLKGFTDGCRVFLSDRRFMAYQFGFALAGFANHMALVFVTVVLKERVIPEWSVQSSFALVGFVTAVFPSLLMTISAPLWGRYLDTINPMSARGLFNCFQVVAFAMHTYGAMTMQIWPFIVGTTFHAIGNGGGTINWLTGSLYFARPEDVSLYNSIHVGLTGVRGMIAPIVGLLIYREFGSIAIFGTATVLSILGAIAMFIQGRSDPGPVNE